jgi:HK97 family phage major capsid protein
MESLETDWGLPELKALFQTTAGWPPQPVRIPGLIIEAPTRPIQVLDIIPVGTTDQAAVVYMQETTRTHAAAERAEGAAYAESAFALTEQSSPVRSIGDSIPVTDEQLEDVAGVESYLNQRLTFGLQQRLDSQVLNGNGTAPNLRGILNTTGIQTQARGADPVPDAVYRAMTLVRVNGRARPNAFVVHPNDWQDVRLLRTADGLYIWGNPSEPGPERIWGVTVVQSDAIPENTGLVGDFNWCQLFERRGVEVAVGYVGSQFTQGQRTIRASLRVAFAVYRPAAFATVTGI